MERLTKIGDVKSKSSSEIKYSRLGIGFEKIDRKLHDPEMAYDKMAETGIKWAYVYWAPTDIMSTDYEGTVTVHLAGIKEKPHLVDLMDGSIYEIPESMIEVHPRGGYYITNLPLKDYPLALTTFC